MRVIYSGLFSKLKQAGINDKIEYYSYSWGTRVSNVQDEFQMITDLNTELLTGVCTTAKRLKLGFPNKRISCKRKRRYQY